MQNPLFLDGGQIGSEPGVTHTSIGCITAAPHLCRLSVFPPHRPPPSPQDPVQLLQAHPDILANSGSEAAVELTADYGELSTKD